MEDQTGQRLEAPTDDTAALPLTSLNEASELLFEARAILGVHDVVLWVRNGGALITEATTVTSGNGDLVDIPVGMGIAGRALAESRVIAIRDFTDAEDLRQRGLRMQQPHVVERQGWRSAIYVPLPFPADDAVIAAYSRTADEFSSETISSELCVWGERSLLRARYEDLAARPLKMAAIYDNFAVHVHDIRQHADSALMNIELLAEGSSRASLKRATEHLHTLRNLCERDLRSVSAIKIRKRLCNIRALALSVKNDFDGLSRLRQIQIEVDCDDRASCLMDPSLLHRCLSNLVANSVRHLSDVSRRPKIIRIAVSETASQTFIDVGDNGPGIQPERIARIFEPGVSFSPNGFGLGLSMVDAAVSTSGGSVRVLKNDFGRGCTFRMALPRRR